MRIKRGVTKRIKKKNVLEAASGYRMTYHKLYRRAKEAVLHAGQYSYAHRRHRPAQLRNEWIKTIAAALTETQLSYSQFVNKLKINKIEIDRKNLAELIVYSRSHFDKIVAELG